MAKQKKDRVRALPHQLAGTAFLRSRERAALFDEQGLGKSKQLIDAIAAEIDAGHISGALIVCPNTLKTNWAEEIEKHSGRPYAVFGAGRKARRHAFCSLRASFYIINYEAISSELPSLRALLRFKRMALVLDESHRIKTPTSKVTNAVHQLRHEAARRFAMTGTPVANKPEDLWSQVFFLDDGEALGATFEEFQDRYCTGRGGYVHVDQIRERVGELSLRRTKDEALQLPTKTVQRVSTRMSGRQLDLYDCMRNELAVWVRSLSGDEVLREADSILARMIRLAQLASNPRLIDAAYTETPAKFAALDELLLTYRVAKEQKAIVWTSFVPNIPELIARYPALRPVCIHGDMATRERDRAVRLFRTDDSVRLLIANPAAAREGLTLTSANVAVYVDRTFNLVDFLQSQDRIHRISQTKPCHVLILTAEGTIDEFVEFSLAQKHRLARFAQSDTDAIASDDLELRKPDVLRALLSPAVASQFKKPRRKAKARGKPAQD